MLFAQEPAAASPQLPTEALIFFGGIGIVVLFFPAFIAALRGHRSTLGIGALCLFFGWTVIGWLVALVWSLSDTGRSRR